MNALRFAVDPDVRLHPEIPLIVLLGLMHLGVAGLALVLRRRRRVNDRGIDDAARDGQPQGSEVGVHQSEYLLTQARPLHGCWNL